MCDDCEWEDALDLAESLLADGLDEISIADTVTGIRDWIDDNHHVTEKQQAALERISAVQAFKDEADWERS